jgi:hypothetical protein
MIIKERMTATMEGESISPGKFSAGGPLPEPWGAC